MYKIKKPPPPNRRGLISLRFTVRVKLSVLGNNKRFVITGSRDLGGFGPRSRGFNTKSDSAFQ